MKLNVRTRVRQASRLIFGANALAKQALTLPVGQITLGEARALGDLVSGLTTPGPIIEVGTLFGWSTRVMVLFKQKDRKLITIDNFGWNPLALPAEDHFESTSIALSEAVRNYSVELVRQDKDEFYSQYDGPAPALVFLDAIHSYEETKKDIEWARHAGAGAICLHDYAPQHPGVVRAVDELGGKRLQVESLVVMV